MNPSVEEYGMNDRIRFAEVKVAARAFCDATGSSLSAGHQASGNYETGPFPAPSHLESQGDGGLIGKMKTVKGQFEIPAALISTLILGLAMAAAIFMAVQIQQSGL